jgi:hypothetical protein
LFAEHKADNQPPAPIPTDLGSVAHGERKRATKRGKYQYPQPDPFSGFPYLGPYEAKKAKSTMPEKSVTTS